MCTLIHGKNILVAGATGFIGANMTKRLEELGANILATHYTQQPTTFDAPWQRFDFTKLEDCLEATKCMDYVFILAAHTLGAKAVKENPTAGVSCPNCAGRCPHR